MRISWQRLLLIVIVASGLLGMSSGLFLVKKHISPKQLLQNILLWTTHANSPVDAADSYFSAWEKLQPEIMYRYITSAEQASSNLVNYKNEFENMPLRPIKHTVKSFKLFGRKAMVKLLVSWPTLEDSGTYDKEEYLSLVKEGSSWKVSEAESFNK